MSMAGRIEGKNVKVSTKNHIRLGNMTNIHTSMNDVIGMLLDYWEKHKGAKQK